VERPPETHYDRDLLGMLNKAGVYDVVQKLLLRSGSRDRYVREFVRPFAGCRILDIGCGPADMLAYLPQSVGVYIEGQHWFARWLIARDCGKAVRARANYEARARESFPQVESTILDDTLRVPYTILVMRRNKRADNAA
jgi:hypothetical protein